MNCSIARAAMLDAELDELRGRGATPLAAHLRSCHACHVTAERVLAETAQLRHALDAAVAARTSPRRGRNEARPREVRLRYVVPLIAAAAAAGAILFAGPRIARESRIAPYTPSPAVPSTPVVNAAADGGVAVMSTADPTITVVWSF